MIFLEKVSVLGLAYTIALTISLEVRRNLSVTKRPPRWFCSSCFLPVLFVAEKTVFLKMAFLPGTQSSNRQRISSNTVKRQRIIAPIRLKPGETPIQKPGCKY